MTDLNTGPARSKKNELFDPFNRHLNYLRLSITDRCNLNCTYCVPESQTRKLSHEDILRYEEILHLLEICVGLGINKIRITGGEPFVRKGVFPFLNKLNEIDEINDLALTTNGLFLRDNLTKLKSCGIKRLNISLDSLIPETYLHITGQDAFDKVWEGITLAEKMNFFPIKLNVVALRGINEKELVDLAALSFTHSFHIRFIEYMPVGKKTLGFKHPLLTPEIKKRVQELGELIPVARGTHDGPARRYKFKNAKGEIGFISPLSHHFCNHCNRLRLTASGGLRTCLLSEYQTDLKTPLRSGFSDKEIANLILNAVSHKPMDHNLSDKKSTPVISQMSAIGG